MLYPILFTITMPIPNTITITNTNTHHVYVQWFELVYTPPRLGKTAKLLNTLISPHGSRSKVKSPHGDKQNENEKSRAVHHTKPTTTQE